MSDKENQRVRLTKRLLRESLIELMTKKDIDKISVSELCAGAGINRTTFYNHYGSQYDVLKDIGKMFVKQIAYFGRLHNDEADLTLKHQVTEICRYLRANRTEAILLFNNFNADSDIMKEIFHQRILNQPQYMQFVSHYDDDTKNLLNTFMINGIYGLIKQWLIEDMKKPSEEIGELAINLAENGWMK